MSIKRYHTATVITCISALLKESTVITVSLLWCWITVKTTVEVGLRN